MEKHLLKRVPLFLLRVFAMLMFVSSAALAPDVAVGQAAAPSASQSPAPAAKATPPNAAVAKPSVEEQLIQHLPEDWRSTALRYHIFSDSDAGILGIPSGIEDEARLTALQRLEEAPGAEEFFAKHLEEELAGVRSADPQVPEQANRDFLISLVRAIPYRANWLNSPLATPLLEKEGYGDPDPQVSYAAAEALRTLEASRLLATVDLRLGRISWDYKNHKEEVDQLEQEEQKLLYEKDEIDLPAIMQNPPPVFQIPTNGDSVRVVMMGDFGTGGEDQHKVAAAMVEEHRKKPFDFGLTLGDNFYVDVTSPDDPQLKKVFEDLYGPMGITFYPCFGNHDWGGEFPVIELTYSARNPHWTFPAPYYTYTAGPVQFFVINTEFDLERPDGTYTSVSTLQLRWLQTELAKSKARWKVVYGHVPIYTSLYPDPNLTTSLLPVLKGRADVYISGHVHNLEQHKPVDGVNLFIIGSSGRGEVPVDASDPETIFAKEAYGFGVLEATDHDLTIRLLGEDDKELHSATFHK
jgi:tartrate-resistant acid phosphatase type 5